MYFFFENRKQNLKKNFMRSGRTGNSIRVRRIAELMSKHLTKDEPMAPLLNRCPNFRLPYFRAQYQASPQNFAGPSPHFERSASPAHARDRYIQSFFRVGGGCRMAVTDGPTDCRTPPPTRGGPRPQNSDCPEVGGWAGRCDRFAAASSRGPLMGPRTGRSRP